MKYNFKFKPIKKQIYKRPIYKQIISGICFGIIFSLLLTVIIWTILAIIPIYNTPAGKILIIMLSLLIGLPVFIEIFNWSLK